MPKIKVSGGILVFIGAVLWSLNAPLVKFLSADPMLICGLRSLIAGLTLAPFIRLKRLNWSIWMLVYALSYSMLCITIILALSKTSATVAIGMQYTAAIWLFLANLIGTKVFKKNTFIPVCLVFIGVVFFMFSGSDKNSNAGNLIALSEGVFFAFMTAGAKKSAGTNPLGLTAIANLFTGIFVFIFFSSSAKGLSTLSQVDWIVIIILGVVQIGAGYAFYNLGIQKISAQKASIIALWEMILGPVWTALLVKEYPNMLALAGLAVILVGMVLETVLYKPSEKADNT